ncbi:hypothetical protein B484DRAFT_439048, partial [Ochromonadaceae sp. CCMP2298]
MAATLAPTLATYTPAVHLTKSALAFPPVRFSTQAPAPTAAPAEMAHSGRRLSPVTFVYGARDPYAPAPPAPAPNTLRTGTAQSSTSSSDTSSSSGTSSDAGPIPMSSAKGGTGKGSDTGKGNDKSAPMDHGSHSAAGHDRTDNRRRAHAPSPEASSDSESTATRRQRRRARRAGGGGDIPLHRDRTPPHAGETDHQRQSRHSHGNLSTHTRNRKRRAESGSDSDGSQSDAGNDATTTFRDAAHRRIKRVKGSSMQLIRASEPLRAFASPARVDALLASVGNEINNYSAVNFTAGATDIYIKRQVSSGSADRDPSWYNLPPFYDLV